MMALNIKRKKKSKIPATLNKEDDEMLSPCKVKVAFCYSHFIVFCECVFL